MRPGAYVMFGRAANGVRVFSSLMIQTNLIRNTHTDLICDAAYDFYGTCFATAGLDQRRVLMQILTAWTHACIQNQTMAIGRTKWRMECRGRVESKLERPVGIHGSLLDRHTTRPYHGFHGHILSMANLLPRLHLTERFEFGNEHLQTLGLAWE